MKSVMVVIPKVEFRYDPNHDTNDGREWSEDDIDDLRWELTHGGTVESAAKSAARFLCRWGTIEDVRAQELGLVT